MDNITPENREIWCGGERITVQVYRARQALARMRMQRLRSMSAAPSIGALAAGAGCSARWAMEVLAGRDASPKVYTTVLPGLEAVIAEAERAVFGAEVPPLDLEPAREAERVS